MPDRLDPARAHEILAFGPFQLQSRRHDQGGNGGGVWLRVVGNVEEYRIPPISEVEKFPCTFSASTACASGCHAEPRGPPRLAARSLGTKIRRPTPTRTVGILSRIPSKDIACTRAQKAPTGHGHCSRIMTYPLTLMVPIPVSSTSTPTRDCLNNIEYFYSLTSYSMPDRTINFPSQESSIVGQRPHDRARERHRRQR